jgi:hypothetical protein
VVKRYSLARTAREEGVRRLRLVRMESIAEADRERSERAPEVFQREQVRPPASATPPRDRPGAIYPLPGQ